MLQTATSHRVRIGAGQILVEPGKPEANLQRAVAAIEALGERGCQFVVLPECLDLGWTDASARTAAEPIPGPRTERLAEAARRAGVYVAAGLVERSGERLFNSAVLLDPRGEVALLHRKINELDIGLELYSVGDRLGVAHTEFGVVGLSICADNFSESLAIAHVLARMGAQLILSPSAWARPAEHDNVADPYGGIWRKSYTELTRLYDVTIAGVSNVGWIENGAWAGRKCIGCSLIMGPGGEILAQGPYGPDAQMLLTVDVELKRPIARGADMAAALQQRGYRGP